MKIQIILNLFCGFKVKDIIIIFNLNFKNCPKKGDKTDFYEK